MSSADVLVSLVIDLAKKSNSAKFRAQKDALGPPVPDETLQGFDPPPQGVPAPRSGLSLFNFNFLRTNEPPVGISQRATKQVTDPLTKTSNFE